MSSSRPHHMTDTHEVMNQPAPRGDLDLWEGDPALRDHAGAADGAHLGQYGRKIGRLAMREAAMEANRHPPEAQLFDTGGRRLDEVTYHPTYHMLMQAGLGAGYAALPWEGATGGHSTHAAMVYMTSQVEPGVCCPMTMTYAAVPALRASRPLFDEWVPKLTARLYDPAVAPLARKAAATLGMALTEKQGGSDLGGTTTTAVRDGDAYRLRGHKWFCSAPMSDGFVTLAQAPGGLTAFLVPRWPEGTRNNIHILRLKNKLGNRSNALAEIEYADALAYPLGDEGDGIRRVIKMIHHTRLDTALAPAGLMRAALGAAHHWCAHRSVAGAQLIDQPLMRSVLADLALDWEGALALGMAVARAFDGSGERDRAFARLGVALAKFLGNRLCPTVVGEAMECLGGMGYIEDTGLPLLYREAPLNSIWEGSGNVICLDILRTLRSVPAAGEVLSDMLAQVTGEYRRYDAALRAHMGRFPRLPEEGQARWYASSLATLLTASVLIRGAPPAIAEAYIATRLAGERGSVPGAIAGVDTAAILARLG
ncbi:DNA alkylation response protein [Pelagivirga sediminicola]|uniref:DNA alkylation response protein n=1 Tax=Pelagivirga sediminicola TaxID=2170575 RepID=A0A2T7G848_9RHOB|nr:acyl-CoA dehydrogenase family protein [Pelagivirga sediminicola]PVA10603.1 DNA alkylation response protein [Pelagivirga sediminicola]